MPPPSLHADDVHDRVETLTLERGASRPEAVLQVLEEHGREAKDKGMRVVSQPKTAWIPAEFPAMGVNQVRDSPDQRLFAHTADVVVCVVLERDPVCQLVFIKLTELLDPRIHREHHGRKV
jgi:hypothetical protein